MLIDIQIFVYHQMYKPIEFRGSSLDDLRNFPQDARREANLKLDRVQRGLMSKKHFTNIWDVIEDTPQEAASLKIRAELIIALQEHIKNTGLTQAQAAKQLGVTQPRVSDLMRGKINLFSLESL
jgi:predicted XRE-type DNA-binding protein